MVKKTRSKISDRAWMDTYSDMVTLLMCFFVMLFSMSTVDAQKWQVLVQGFNPDAESVSQVVPDNGREAANATTAVNDGGSALLTDDGGQSLSDSSGDKDATASEKSAANGITTLQDVTDPAKMNEYLSQYIKEHNLGDRIRLYEGSDYTFVTFSNNVFFDGDSSVLRQTGKSLLDTFGAAISQISSQIYKMQVIGHTNQSDPDKPNNIFTDRYLSSDRAVEVLIYLQEKGVLDGRKMESIGYGQHYPAGDINTAEGRSKNRRVELLIGETPYADLNLDKIYSDIEKAQATGAVSNDIIDTSVVEY